MQDKPTLCWKCAKACGECSWSDGTFTHVDPNELKVEVDYGSAVRLPGIDPPTV